MKHAPDEAVTRLLQLVGDHLESYLDGDDEALETLGEAIEQHGFTGEELGAAILVLRRLGARGGAARQPFGDAPGKDALRILSAQEREALGPEAWGFLLSLRARGSLNAGQFERVVDILAGSGLRPVSVDLARDVATRVALDVDDPSDGPGDPRHGDLDLAH